MDRRSYDAAQDVLSTFFWVALAGYLVVPLLVVAVPVLFVVGVLLFASADPAPGGASRPGVVAPAGRDPSVVKDPPPTKLDPDHLPGAGFVDDGQRRPGRR